MENEMRYAATTALVMMVIALAPATASAQVGDRKVGPVTCVENRVEPYPGYNGPTTTTTGCTVPVGQKALLFCGDRMKYSGQSRDNFTGCETTSGPNKSLFCGEWTYRPGGAGGPGHGFTGCRLRVGAVTAECGESSQSAHWSGPGYKARGCDTSAGPACTEFEGEAWWDYPPSHSVGCTVGPVAVGCFYFGDPPGSCDISIGPGDDLAFSCRIDLSNPGRAMLSCAGRADPSAR